MTVANLIYRFTYTDESVIALEFIFGDAAATGEDFNVIVGCDESIVGDFDCDDVHAVADLMIDEAIEKTNGRFPADHDRVHDGIVERLMQCRADASLKAHDDSSADHQGYPSGIACTLDSF